MPAVFIVAISLQRPASWGSAARVLTGAEQPATAASTGTTRRMKAIGIRLPRGEFLRATIAQEHFGLINGVTRQVVQ